MAVITVKASDTSLSAKTNLTYQQLALPEWLDWATDALWYIARYASQAYFQHEPISNITEQRVEFTTGSIKFNSNDIGSHAYIDLEAKSDTPSVYLDITVKASTDFLNAFVDTILVSLTNMEDGDMPITMHLGHNGLAVYAIKSTSKLGTYRAMFSEEGSNKWDCGAVLYNYNAATTSLMNVDDNNIIFNADKTRYYIRPSASEETVQLCNVQKDFSVSDLYNQFYDNKLQDFVYVLKDLAIGDVIHVKDVISGISYDAENNRTILEFDTKFGTAKWPFDGDLTSIYSVGNRLEFEFEVVNEYEDETMTFENINYFKEAYAKLTDATVSLNISDYIIE